MPSDPNYLNGPDKITKMLRYELVMINNDNKLKDGYVEVTWKNPVRCSECNDFILTYN